MSTSPCRRHRRVLYPVLPLDRGDHTGVRANEVVRMAAGHGWNGAVGRGAL